MRTILVATDGQHLLQITYVRDNFWRRVDGAKRNPPIRMAVDSGGNSTASIHPSMIIPESSVLLQINPFLRTARTFIVCVVSRKIGSPGCARINAMASVDILPFPFLPWNRTSQAARSICSDLQLCLQSSHYARSVLSSRSSST